MADPVVEPELPSGAPELNAAAENTAEDASSSWRGWGNPTDSSSSSANPCTSDTKKKTLADIMAEEEAAKEMETEDERIMREAMAASLLDANHQNLPDEGDMKMPSDPSNTNEVDDGLDEDMRRAIALSLQEQEQAPDQPGYAAAAISSTAAAAAAAPEENMNETEAEAIARAIQEADDAEAAASLTLAMELQREEEAKRQATSRHQSGNVTTMDREDFFHQKTGHDVENEERQLWGADDYDRYEEQHGVYEKYHRQHASAEEDDEGFRMNAATPSKAWSRLDRNIIVGPNNETRTKHDIKLKAQSNATRLLGREAVDGSSGISDQAYNSLKQNIKKRGTVKGVERHGTGRAENYGGGKTRGGAMDGNVRLVVTRAINTGLIEKCNGVVKEGKEAIVYHANAGQGTVDDDGNIVGGSNGMDVAVKVFKRIQEFKGRRAYVDGDPRYHGTKFKNVDSRKQVEIWAEKEYRNLIRANRAGAPVPTPLMQKENVLFMRFLGEDGWPSPQLREVDIKKGSKRWTTLYGQVMVAVRRLYHCARLVHGDLSEYNILLCPSQLIENSGIWERKDTKETGDSEESGLEIVLIDLGQAVERQHPSSKELLMRDLAMVSAFFTKQGIRVLSENDAIDFILAPCENGVNDTEDVEEEEEEEKCRADVGTDSKEICVDLSSTNEASDAVGVKMSADERTWRYSVPGWDSAADLERLQAKLKSTKPAK